MSKCRPDKKKLRRRLQTEHKTEVNVLQRVISYKDNELSVYKMRNKELEERNEKLRVTLREFGNDHELKYQGFRTDGTLVSYGTVKAEDLEFKVSGRTKDAVEEMLVGKLAKALIANGLVRIEEVYPRSYEDMHRGTVTFSARIDVIPWYKIVKPEIVTLDMDHMGLVAKVDNEHRERIRQKIIEEGENA